MLNMSVDEGSGTPATTATSTVAAVNVKLPPSWPADPQVWFAQVETRFTTRTITAQKTKYDYILPLKCVTWSWPRLPRTPTTSSRISASEQKRLQQLLNAEELGDRKPSQVLCRMQELLGDKASSIDKSFLHELFLQRLPANIRMCIDTRHYRPRGSGPTS